MSKPRAVPVPEAEANGQQHHAGNDRGAAVQEPLSGSKKVKNRNHVDHNNPQG
ncbi:small acid-soluble spore protein P [Paenibacillus aquistagni]|uniref:Small acid-soluble spore protein P (Minor) n=1 Tax=Paenibacillus aquistagni TaxID=1852522 RepID=A0A1X7LZL8_9BACL|nr:small acid-soluble spore protein P [Paenibacillus aquistagni]SMG58549.1 small acid-soluble spore protein P (minor) [Paenibacillus aquistagni]